MESPILREVLRRAEQHRGMTVMAARMHDTGVAGGVGDGIDFLDRQRIHICAQANGAGRRSAFERAPQGADYTGSPDVTGDFNVPFFQN
ncbi:hypothetical protein SOM63_00205 [Pseudomonas viridiflava]|nr:hypothetical protein [Pseudomonas viridiflava]MDY0933878.1 hypothetical protein [Pseudomonas viridiflava]MDY1010411.1 hypothetical protein [Pseudomonas viridiflava]